MESAAGRRRDWTISDRTILLSEIWQRLEHAVTDLQDPLRTPVFATFGPPEEYIVRTVVLRLADRHQRALACYCDARSPKVRHLSSNPAVQWLFFDPAVSVQIRVSGRARIHQHDDVTRHAWERTPVQNRINYATIHPPGAKLEHPSPDLPLDIQKARDDSKAGEAYANFAVVITEVLAMDWLMLSSGSNCRAGFVWDGNAFSGNWLTP